MKNLKTKFTSKPAQIFFMLGFLFLASCSSSDNTAGSLDSSSRAQDLSGKKPLAYCNQWRSNEYALKAKAFLDDSENVRYDVVVLSAESLPADFGKDTSYISFFRWKATSSAAPTLDKKALKYAFYNPSTEQYITQWQTSMRWSDISTHAANMGVYYVKDFLKKVQIVVNIEDTAGDYDALKLVRYDFSSHKNLDEVNGLLPVFHANPTDYAVESDGSQRALVLQKLHPFYDLKGSRSSQEFFTMANQFCF